MAQNIMKGTMRVASLQKCYNFVGTMRRSRNVSYYLNSSIEIQSVKEVCDIYNVSLGLHSTPMTVVVFYEK